MTDLPYFLKLIQNNELICRAATGYPISEHDLTGYDHTKVSSRKISLNGFRLNENEHFDHVDISITKYGTLIDLISDDPKYFENMSHYFNSSRRVKQKPATVSHGKEFMVKGRKTEKYMMMKRCVHGTVFRSDLYGCKISLGFFEQGIEPALRTTFQDRAR